MIRNYQDPEYKEWRKKVRARDNNTCQFPNCRSKSKLQVHHILKWQDYPGLRYHLQNGITLCALHHKTVTGNEEHYIKLFGEIVRKNNG